MSSKGSKSSKGSTPKATTAMPHGETLLFTVSAQKPSQQDPHNAANMFNPVMRMPPLFQPYQNSPTPPPQTRTPPPSTIPAKRQSPAPLTFITQKPATRPLDMPIKKRKTQGPRPPKYKYTNKKTPFSIHRPLKNIDDVHKDIWTNILSCCPPRFLLQAKAVCSLFHDILSHQAIWREARQQHLLADTPPCPQGLTEQQYTDLLCGKGCQSASCRRENTVTANWALLVRFCPDCLMARTTRNQDLPVSRIHQIGSKTLAEALPMLSVNASHRSEPREVRTDEDDEDSLEYADPGRTTSYRFLRSDYDRLEAEYLRKREEGASNLALQAWFKEKSQETLVKMQERFAIHRWHVNDSYCSTNPRIRADRVEFFAQKARELDPPMSQTTLDCFASYQKAITTQNPPTERSWETLKAKILPYREHAEELEQAMKRDERAESDDIVENLSEHRSGANRHLPTFKPEQEHVLNIAKVEFKRCLDEGVSDADLVLLTLKNVYDRYYSQNRLPQGLNFNGRNGPYSLSLDDCRLIIDHVIKKEIPSSSQRATRVFSSFRCPACVKEKDRGRLHTFGGCFEHLLNAHGKTVGDGPEFWRYALSERPQRGVYWFRAIPFPFLSTRWPRNLPVLPEHQDPTQLEPWDPASTRPYIREVISTTSLFAGRRVNETIDADSFLDYFLIAAKALVGIRLPAQALIRIAFQFTLDSSQRKGLAQPSITEFMDATTGIQAVNPAMDFRFRCGKCMSRMDQKASARHVKHNIPLGPLYLHWSKVHDDAGAAGSGREHAQISHDDDDHWTVSFMHMPSDFELFDLVTESDKLLEKEKQGIRDATDGGNARRKPKAKASVILQTPLAIEAFSELFPLA